MKLIDPVLITDAMLASSSVAETDYPEWSADALYALGDRAIVAAGHRVYESVIDGNFGNDPTAVWTAWVDVGPTNRWAMLVPAAGPRTIADDPIIVQLAPANAVDSLGLLDVDGASVRVQVNVGGPLVYDTMRDGAAALTFLDLPAGAGQLITVTIAPLPGGQAAVGKIVIGDAFDIGVTESGPTVTINDYSKRTTDDFGVTTIVKRNWSKQGVIRSRIESSVVDEVQRRVSAVRARPALWVGEEGYESLTLYGYFKDFSENVTIGSTSYCSLTIEGMPSDDGALSVVDPSPGRPSDFFVLRPVAVTDAVLVNTTVPENDYPQWLADVTYALGDRVIAHIPHRIYESTIAGNIGNSPEAGATQWIDIGPTNRWAMFDQALGSATAANSEIEVVLAPGVAVTGVALVDLTATTVRVRAPGYDRTLSTALDGGSLTDLTFLDLATDPGDHVTVTIAPSAEGVASVGALVIGATEPLGVTEDAPSIGINDYSVKNTDDFGNTTPVERAWAKRMTARSLVATSAVDNLIRRVASLRATPALWIAQEGFDSLTIYGFFKDFSVSLVEPASICGFTIEGLTTAMAAGVMVIPPNAIIGGTKNPQTGQVVGGTTAGDVAQLPEQVADNTAAIVQAQVDINGLIDTYGETADAAASADAAAQYAEDAQAAKDLAGEQADISTGAAATATAAAGTAGSKADEAGQHAAAALESETNSQTYAGQSQTFAGQAAASKVDAEGAANSAALMAGVTASTMASTFPHTALASALTGYYYLFDAPALPDAAQVTPATVEFADTSPYYSVGVWTLKTIPYVVGSIWRLRATISHDVGASTAYTCPYVISFDVNGTQIGETSMLGSVPYSSGYRVPHDVSFDLTLEGLPAGTAYVRLGILLNRLPDLSNMPGPYQSTLYAMWPEDISSEKASEANANASALSAASAASYDDAAGAHALAAQQSETNAAIDAGNAHSDANIATGAAASASVDAATALENSSLSASVGSRAINRDPGFLIWNNGQVVPDNWAVYAGIDYISKVAGITPKPNAVRFNTTGVGGFLCGMVQAVYGTPPGKYIASIDFTLTAGGLGGILIAARGYNSDFSVATADIPDIYLDHPDVNGTVWPPEFAPPGRYRFDLPFEFSNAATANANIYFITDGYLGLGPKDVTLHSLTLRPVTELDELSAQVKVLAGALANAGGQQSAFWQAGAAIPGSAASASISVVVNNSDPGAAPLTAFNASGLATYYGTSFVGRTLARVSGPDHDWSYGMFSVESYVAGYAGGNFSTPDKHMMICLSPVDPTVNNPFYSNGYLAIYCEGTGAVRAYAGGLDYGVISTTCLPTDFWEVYLDNSIDGGHAYWRKNGRVVFEMTGKATSAPLRLMCSMYDIGGVLSNLVFGAAPPSTNASIAMVAPEIALGNPSGSVARVAMKIAGGDVAISGNLYSTGKIIMGNGNTGWEVAARPKAFNVTDGSTVLWDDLGYIPNYSILPTGLAPLSSGEAYSLYLDNLSSSGATARLKINVPGAVVPRSVSGDAAGSGGAPDRVISKGALPDAANNQYRFQGSFSFSAQAVRNGPNDYTALIDWSYSLYAKIGGTWTYLGGSSGTFAYNDTVGGLKTYNGGYDKTVTAPAGITDFGASGTSLASVSWTSQSSSSVRSASPNGETTSLTVTP